MKSRQIRMIGLMVLCFIVACGGKQQLVMTSTAGEQDIVEILEANEAFSMFVSLLETADLLPLLHAKGPLTVFAPSNTAFAELPEETLFALRTNRVLLKSILR